MLEAGPLAMHIEYSQNCTGDEVGSSGYFLKTYSSRFCLAPPHGFLVQPGALPYFLHVPRVQKASREVTGLAQIDFMEKFPFEFCPCSKYVFSVTPIT